jgi:hypothetical protein
MSVFSMSEHVNEIEAVPPDVSLMLRAHAELRSLTREVVPVLRQIETRAGLPEDQHEAALAYLELAWSQARRCACEGDAAHAQLCARRRESDGSVFGEGEEDLFLGACRYYEAVRALRDRVARQVGRLLPGGEATTALPVGRLAG